MSSDELKYFFELDELGDFAAVRPSRARGVSRRTGNGHDCGSEFQQSESPAQRSLPGNAEEPETSSCFEGSSAEQPQNGGGDQQRSTNGTSDTIAGDRINPSVEQPVSAVPPDTAVLGNVPVPVASTIKEVPSARAWEVTACRASAATADDNRSRFETVSAAAWDKHDLLSVHALGQFEFCSRSGIYSAEHVDDTDFDEPPPRLDYLPNFDLELIEEQLSRLLRQVPLGLLAAVMLVLAMVGGVALRRRGLFYGSFAAFALGLLWFIELVRKILVLGWRRMAAKRAALTEPSPTVTTIQAVNWWSLLKAGFEPATYRRPFRHPELPLEGRPWRVLERGSQRIPVIKSDARKLGDTRYTVYAKHELRLAAYAMLLGATEHIEVPYGVVFPADSHRGLAVPITPELRQRVIDRLRTSLELLHQSQSGVAEPRPPKQRKKCLRCQLGQPVPLSNAEIAKAREAGERLLVLQKSIGRTYHCACGDRFGSAPPHGRILQLGLAVKVE